MSVVSGLDWPTCRAVLEASVPGAVAQAVKDADTFFGVELPALGEWAFGAEQAAAIHCPCCRCSAPRPSPCGWTSPSFLRSSLPHVEECTIDGVGHLLHVQRPQPVARAMAEFLARNAIAEVPTGDIVGMRAAASSGDQAGQPQPTIEP